MQRVISTPKQSEKVEAKPMNNYANPRIKEKEACLMEVQSKRKLDNEEQSVLSISIDNEDEHVVTGDQKGIIRIFNLYTGKLINRITANPSNMPVQALRFKNNHKYQMLSASCDGTIKMSHILTTKRIWEIKEENQNQTLSLDMKQKMLVTGGSDMVIRVYDESTQKVVTRLEGVDGLANSHNNRIFQVKYIDQDENALLSAGTDRNVMLWDIRAKGIQQSFNGAVVLGEQLDTYNNYLAVASNSIEKALCIYDLRNMSKRLKNVNKDITQQEKQHYGQIEMAFSCNFSRNNKDMCSLFCTAYDNVMIYDVEQNFKPYAQIDDFKASAYCSTSGNLTNKFLFGTSLGVTYYLNLKKKE